MEFDDLRIGTIIWPEASEIRNKIMIILNKNENSVKLASYNDQLKTFRYGQVFQDEWKMRTYDKGLSNQKFKIDSEHCRIMIKEIMSGELI